MSKNNEDDPEPERYYEWQIWKLRQERKMKEEVFDTTSAVFHDAKNAVSELPKTRENLLPALEKILQIMSVLLIHQSN